MYKGAVLCDDCIGRQIHDGHFQTVEQIASNHCVNARNEMNDDVRKLDLNSQINGIHAQTFGKGQTEARPIKRLNTGRQSEALGE